MKKIITVLFVSLLLFSSCKFAEALNAKTGLKAPSDQNIITVFADFDSSNYCLVDLGDSFVWDKTALSLNKLLEYENFASWYASLTNGEWKSLGLYDPYTEKGLLSGDAEFTVSQKEAFYVGWNSPFERVRVLANNTTDKFFDYYLETDHAYDEEVVVNYNELIGDSSFSSWINELGNFQYGGYYLHQTKFSTEKITSENCGHLNLSDTVSVTKWNFMVLLGWAHRYTFNSISIYAENGTGDICIVPLDEYCEDYYLTWNSIKNNKTFRNWYEGLTNPGYAKDGLYIFEKYYIDDTQYSRKNIINENFDSSLHIRFDTSIYVNWTEPLSSVTVHANNGKDETFDLSLPEVVSSTKLRWYDFEKNDAFMTWYKGRSNDSYKIAGLGTYEYSLNIFAYNCNGTFNVSSSQRDIYIIWADEFQNPTWAYLELSESEYVSAGESVQLRYRTEGNTYESDLSSYQTGIESVSFTSDNPGIAEVDSHGMVTGKSGGTANITVTMTSYSGVSVSTVRSIYVMENPEFEKRRIYNESYKYISSYDVSDDGKVFACNISSDLYVSTDAASNWSTTSISRGNGGYSPTNSIDVSSSGKCIVCPINYCSETGLYKNHYYYLYLSKDYGKTFKCIKELISGDLYNLCVSDDGNVVFYTNMNQGYYTTDGGENWSAFLSDIGINSISISSTGQYVACGTSNGLYMSDDYGMNWDLVSDDNSVSKLRMSSDGSRIVYMTDGTLRIYDMEKDATEIITLPESQTYAYYFYASPDCIKYMVNSEKETGVWYYYDGFSWTRLNQYISTDSLKMILSNNSVSFIDENGNLYLWNTN